MPETPKAPRAATPIRPPAGWLVVRTLLGPLLGVDTKEALADSLGTLQELEPGEQAGYAIFLLYRILEVLADNNVRLQHIEQRLARASGVARQNHDELAGLQEELLETFQALARFREEDEGGEAGEGEEEPGEDEVEEEEPEEEEPAPRRRRKPSAPPAAPPAEATPKPPRRPPAAKPPKPPKPTPPVERIEVTEVLPAQKKEDGNA